MRRNSDWSSWRAWGARSATVVLAVLLVGAVCGAGQHEVRVTPVLQKDLADMPGREALVLLVEYPPGGADPVHRHDAHGFVYVLEGSIVMGVKGGKEVTLGPGDMFYEGPDDVHTVGRNASDVKPARFLVFLLKRKGAEVLIPVME